MSIFWCLTLWKFALVVRSDVMCQVIISLFNNCKLLHLPSLLSIILASGVRVLCDQKIDDIYQLTNSQAIYKNSFIEEVSGCFTCYQIKICLLSAVNSIIELRISLSLGMIKSQIVKTFIGVELL